MSKQFVVYNKKTKNNLGAKIDGSQKSSEKKGTWEIEGFYEFIRFTLYIALYLGCVLVFYLVLHFFLLNISGKIECM